jgi:poly-beta-1,6-N-acetyl-D-glucosamine synthase
MTCFVLFCILSMLAYTLLIFYFLSGFKSEKLTLTNDLSTTISVIIPVRNEELNIVNLLNSISKQEYNQSFFEVIIVNDHSEDATEERVLEYLASGKIKDIQLLQLTETSGKKKALELGIKHAKGELIVTVDADCLVSPKWLWVYAQHFKRSSSPMMAGPVLISGEEGVLASIQQLDYLAMQVCGLGSLSNGNVLLCSGANLAFSRAAFMKVNGYEGNEHLASGDDTFLMIKINEQIGPPVSIIDERAAVTCLPLKTVKEVIQQRARWGGKVSSYNSLFIKSIALLVMTVNALFIISLLLLMFGSFSPFLIVVPGKLFVDFLVLKKGLNFFQIDKPSALAATLIFYPFFLVFLGLASFRGNYNWKGRSFIAGL